MKAPLSPPSRLCTFFQGTIHLLLLFFYVGCLEPPILFLSRTERSVSVVSGKEYLRNSAGVPTNYVSIPLFLSRLQVHETFASDTVREYCQSHKDLVVAVAS